MWFADQHKIELLMQQKWYEQTIASKLQDKYGLRYSDLTPLQLDDDEKWRTLNVNASRLERRVTDDGCEHYQHKNGRYFVLDYHFKNNEWEEVERDKYDQTPHTPKESFLQNICKLFMK